VLQKHTRTHEFEDDVEYHRTTAKPKLLHFQISALSSRVFVRHSLFNIASNWGNELVRSYKLSLKCHDRKCYLAKAQRLTHE